LLRTFKAFKTIIMKKIVFLLCLLAGCTVSTDDTQMINNAPSTPLIIRKTTYWEETFNYRVDPYTEEIQAIGGLFLEARSDYLNLEQKTSPGEIEYIKCGYEIIVRDTIKYDSLHYKIRMKIKAEGEIPDFFDGQHLLEVYEGILVVDNKYIFATKLGALAVVPLIDKGIILNRNPFEYEMHSYELLENVAEKFHVLESQLKSWNPHIRNGYSKGTVIKIYWSTM